MNINETIRDWLDLNRSDFPSLAPVDFVTMGEIDDLSPPFLVIYETASGTIEQGNVIMHGVAAYEIILELHTVAQDEDQDGTPLEDDQQMRSDIWNIVGNRESINSCNGLNGWTVFDIRASHPTTESSEGRRLSRFALTVICCPS